MKQKIADVLEDFITENYDLKEAAVIRPYLPALPLDPAKIKGVMINEIVAPAPEHDFYSNAPCSDYMQTTLRLFLMAGVNVSSVWDILDLGIYITSAVKVPKTETAISREQIRRSVPLLKKELALFPSLQAVMLMGDVARKAVNMIAKEETKKNAIPSGSTYKIRHQEFYYNNIRLLPAYIMTGKNLMIEKSKTEMSAEELQKMIDLI